jgi:hypothetical protein
MTRTLLIGDEIALGNSAAGGSNISNATVVRLYNGVGSTAIVSMASTVGAADTVSFSMPAEYVEFLEKPSSYVIWASSTAVKATKVGFTG